MLLGLSIAPRMKWKIKSRRLLYQFMKVTFFTFPATLFRSFSKNLLSL